MVILLRFKLFRLIDMRKAYLKPIYDKDTPYDEVGKEILFIHGVTFSKRVAVQENIS